MTAMGFHNHQLMLLTGRASGPEERQPIPQASNSGRRLGSDAGSCASRRHRPTPEIEPVGAHLSGVGDVNFWRQRAWAVRSDGWGVRD